MSYAPRSEQETHYSYEPENGYWQVYSTYPPHIRKIIEVAADVHGEQDANGRFVYVRGHVDKNQVRLFQPRL